MSSKIKKPRMRKPVVKKPNLSGRGKYENKQYSGGRVKGAKNLRYFEDIVVNQFGVTFTLDEKKELENLVNRANQKRKKLLKDDKNIVVFSGGQSLKTTYGKMGRESDFAIQRKSKSINKYESREEFDKYVKMLKRVNTKGYIDDRVNQYKENYIKAIRGQGFDETLVKDIENMTDEQFFEFAKGDELIKFVHAYNVYDREKIAEGMKRAVQRHKGG